MPAETKARIMDATADLFRRQGYTGTGIKQIVSDASAPFASIYHFFPGGKEQLGAEVIRRSGQLYLELFIMIAADAPDVATGLELFFTGAAEHLEETDYADACPIATVALEVASTSEPLREATADVFNTWIDAATEYFVLDAVPHDTAREVAFVVLSLLEGAFLFCRALKSTEPMRVAGAAAVAALVAARPEWSR
jgi:AcrR family transcriptional regulator